MEKIFDVLKKILPFFESGRIRIEVFYMLFSILMTIVCVVMFCVGVAPKSTVFCIALIITAFSYSITLAWLYSIIENNFKDNKIKKDKIKQDNKKIKLFLKSVKPLFEELNDGEKNILKTFVNENSEIIVIENNSESNIQKVERMKSLFKQVELDIIILLTYPTLTVQIETALFDILKEYFK